MEIEWRKYKKKFNKDIELKSKQITMYNTINEIKNSLEGINSRITEAEERISDLEEKILEITTTEQNKEDKLEREKLWPQILQARKAGEKAYFRGPFAFINGRRIYAKE